MFKKIKAEYRQRRRAIKIKNRLLKFNRKHNNSDNFLIPYSDRCIYRLAKKTQAKYLGWAFRAALKERFENEERSGDDET